MWSDVGWSIRYKHRLTAVMSEHARAFPSYTYESTCASHRISRTGNADAITKVVTCTGDDADNDLSIYRDFTVSTLAANEIVISPKELVVFY